MIIGIGGVSRAGKTTLADQLNETLTKKGKTVEVLCQDDFVKPKIALPKVQGQLDWERPGSIKWDVLLSSLKKSTAEITIVEGLFAFYPADLRSHYHHKIFIEIEKDVFLSRKESDTRWGEEPEWYAEHIWRSYMKYGQKKADGSGYLTIDGSKPFDLQGMIDQMGITFD